MKKYTDFFYTREEKSKRIAAQAVLGLVFEKHPQIQSVVDVGCGSGLWLDVALKAGVKVVQGFDGFWIDEKSLLLPKEFFQQVDLNEPLPETTRYDLAISLEVAEHLLPESAESFVAQLAGLSDQVLFSAAIPNQGGVNHFNEQWASYWVGLFEAQGYWVHDFIRPTLWCDENIPFYYRQNILFFSRVEEGSLTAENRAMPINVVHPVLFDKATSPSIKISFNLLCKAIKRRLRF